MGSTVGLRMKKGEVEGTGADISVVLPFAPRKVELFNIDGDCFLFWAAPMGAGTGMKTIDDGTTAFITTLGVTPVDYVDMQDGDRGFTIGADTDVNVSAETIVWCAWE